jgi:AcrR family transcriptional regulator
LAKDSVRELLIVTAADLFSKKRYLDTSIRDIGEAAKVNPSLVYHYFKNKEEILYTIIERFSILLLNSLLEVQTNETDPVEGLRKMLFRHLSFNNELRKAVKITIEENTLLKGRRRAEVVSFQRKIYGLYMDQLRKLEQLNLLRHGNLTVITFSIFGVINWFYRWYKEGGQLNDEIVANQMIENIFSGILNSDKSTRGAQA